MRFSVVALSAIVLYTFAAAQDIYKYKDDKGQWRFSQTPPAQGGAEKIPDNSKPLTLPRDISCSTFTVGESRTTLAENPGHNAPVQFGDVRVKLIDQTDRASRYGWQVVVKNVSGRKLTAAAAVKLMDCDLYPIAQGQMKFVTVEGYRESTLDGEITVQGSRGAQVGRFNVALGTAR